MTIVAVEEYGGTFYRIEQVGASFRAWVWLNTPFLPVFDKQGNLVKPGAPNGQWAIIDDSEGSATIADAIAWAQAAIDDGMVPIDTDPEPGGSKPSKPSSP